MSDSRAELAVSFETFKDVFIIWVNQGSWQTRIELSQTEGLNFLKWLLEEGEENWPYFGLPLAGSKYVDYFKPEDKEVALHTFGFKTENFTAFKCFDIEYSAKSLEIMSGRLELTFLQEAVDLWIQAAKDSIQYAKLNSSS